MFGALVRSRMSALFASFFSTLRKKKGSGAGTKILMAILFVYVIGCFCFLFGNYFSALCQPLVSSGLGWLYFSMAGMTAFALCFIGSVFTAQQQLFSAKDNDLLLSMPIPPAYILGSRMLMLLALSYVFELMVMGPAAYIYCTEFAPSVRGIVVFAVCCLFLPLLVLIFSCVFGWLLAMITDRVRNKSLVTTVCSLIFLAAYFYVFSNVNKYLTMMLVNSSAIGERIHASVYPAWAFGSAIADGSVSALLGWLACCVIPMALVFAVLMRTFISVTTAKRGAAKIKYREKALKVKSQKAALLGRELRHFFSNGMYIMNAGLGSIFTLAAAVALVIYKDKVLAFGAMAPGVSPAALVAAGLCLMGTVSMISAPSVSLEGKNISVIRALPVSSGKVLMAKVNCHLVLAVPPVVLASLVAIVVLRPEPVMSAATLLAPTAFTAFCAFLGVTMNLHFPKLDYINEVAVIKQSMSVMITMFGSMGVVMALGALYLLLLAKVMDAGLYLLIVAAILAVSCWIMYRWIMTKGAARFEELS